MSRFALPAPSDGANASFADVAGCRAWLAGLALTNPSQAQQRLRQELAVIATSVLPPAERLLIMELLREPIAFIQGECAKRFAGRPLPLNPAESLAVAEGQALWQLVAINYLHCLEAALDARKTSRSATLAAERALAATGAAIADCCRGGLLPAQALWRQLHAVYAAVEDFAAMAGPAAKGASPAPNSGGSSRIAAAYIEPLLLFAAQPYALSQKQFNIVSYWARRCAAKVDIVAARPQASKALPLRLDLAASEPARVEYGDSGEGDARWLVMDALRRSLKRRLKALRDGAAPQDLDLGKDCVQPACQMLLAQTYRRWCKGQAQPLPAKPAADIGDASWELAAGIECIHYFLSGGIFRQPGHMQRLSKRDVDKIATFGRIATHHEEELRQGFSLEAWKLAFQGSELGLCRQASSPGGRLSPGQLIAARENGNGVFALGILSWVAMDMEHSLLYAGIRLLPGTPIAVAFRGTGITACNEKFRQGLRLPAMDKAGEPHSIVVPPGIYRAGRILEVYSDRARPVRLQRLLARGSNFERADFEWA